MTPAYDAVQRLNVTDRFIDHAKGPATLKAVARMLQEIGDTWDHYAWLARLDGRNDVSADRTYAVEYLRELAEALTATAKHTAEMDRLMANNKDSTVVLVAVPDLPTDTKGNV